MRGLRDKYGQQAFRAGFLQIAGHSGIRNDAM